MQPQPLHISGGLLYQLNIDDELSMLGEAWADTAASHHAPELTDVRTLIHRPIWDFISGRVERDIYHEMFDHVRRNGQPLTLSYHCDVPTARRRYTLSIEPAQRGGLLLTHTLTRVETRTAVPLFDPHVRRSDQTLTLCGFCNRVQCAGRWVLAEQAVTGLELFHHAHPPKLAPGVCASCIKRLGKRLHGSPPSARSA